MDGKSSVTTAQHTTLEPTPVDTPLYMNGRNVHFYVKPPQKKINKELTIESENTPSPKLSHYPPATITHNDESKPSFFKQKNI